MERTEIAKEYIWDLSSIYNSNEAFYQDVEKSKELINNLESLIDTLCDDFDTFYSFLTTKDSLERIVSKLHCF